ncbi:expressed unknown protein [Seminavis robusta]|uniref:BTB domain-containing protein n=1 Tax=Seminavis robusta TaxID=568900 RepID=A0A9N8E8M4_9STRA|nr:expressed unknown protein [Seminavis robusta]|eukprot:Sro742_g195880.1 n/a (279) ;mRNA; f:15497-16333
MSSDSESDDDNNTVLGDVKHVLDSIGIPNRSRCMREPDVVVVVGKEQEEFQMSSFALRLVSDYFDAAFRSGMKEAAFGRFEFLEKKREEWELIMSIMDPFSNVVVSNDNVDMLLPWFDELCMPQGLDESDKVLFESRLGSGTIVVSNHQVVELLSTSLRYNLARTKAHCFQHVRALFNRASSTGCWQSEEEIGRVLELVAAHADCRRQLWDVFQQYIPTTIMDSSEQDVLIRSGLLESFIVADIKMKKHERELDALQKKVVRHRNLMRGCNDCWRNVL